MDILNAIKYAETGEEIQRNKWDKEDYISITNGIFYD